MLGGTNLPGVGNISVCGTADQNLRESRPDVVTFDSAVLQEDTAVVGEVVAELYVASSARDTDFFVTIDDVHPRVVLKESSFLVRYGAIRMRWRDSDSTESKPLVSGQVYKVRISMGYTAYIFEKGHRFRVSVSSAASPYINPNSNTGTFEPFEKVTPVLAQNLVHFGGAVASAVFLPVVRMEDLPRNQYFDPLLTSSNPAQSALQYV
jgi:hypothetical protein